MGATFYFFAGISMKSLTGDSVILLHGLARTKNAMKKMQDALYEKGCYVVNVGYPSRKYQIEELAEIAVNQGISGCNEYNEGKVHFVTHSLGGILVRAYLKKHKLSNMGRVVMLGPPNQGSEVVDRLKNVPGFRFLNGPAGLQLDTHEQSMPKLLGDVDFDLGVIAGTNSINLILSMFLATPNDGKVSVASTKVKGMKDHICVESSHPFLMNNEEVIRQVIYYLENGAFKAFES